MPVFNFYGFLFMAVILMPNWHRKKGVDFYPEIVIDSVNMTAHMDALLKNEYDGLGAMILKSLENLNGIVIPEDKAQLICMAEKYILEFSADALLLGCTELPLAIKSGEISVPIMDTTAVHIREIFTQANEV